MLHGHLHRALRHEQPAWPEIEAAHRLVLQTAQVLENLGDDTAETVERQFARVLQRMEQEAGRDGSLSASLQHFLNKSFQVEAKERLRQPPVQTNPGEQRS